MQFQILISCSLLEDVWIQLRLQFVQFKLKKNNTLKSMIFRTLSYSMYNGKSKYPLCYVVSESFKVCVLRANKFTSVAKFWTFVTLRDVRLMQSLQIWKNSPSVTRNGSKSLVLWVLAKTCCRKNENEIAEVVSTSRFRYFYVKNCTYF